MDLIPNEAKDIVIYYAALTVLALFLVLRRRPRSGMRLKLGGHVKRTAEVDGARANFPQEHFSHIQPASERPLNVVFNYNGHSWDAYEVLGLPAGSSVDKVEDAYRVAMATIDPTSRPFLQAAFEAIQTQWRGFKKTN